MLNSIKDYTVAYTHGGNFHADDVFSSALVRKLNPDIPIYRTMSVPENLPETALVYDIGMGEFDHHQLEKDLREDGTPYASFGKLWRAYGHELGLSERGLRVIEENLVKAIDYTDNTGNQNPLSFSIKCMNPNWNDTVQDYDTAFNNAFYYAYGILEAQISTELAIDSAVVELNKYASSMSENGVLILDKYIPLANVSEIEGANFVVFPSNRGGYSIQTISDIQEDGTKTTRVPFPEEWLGNPDKSLGMTFCHRGNFLASTETLEQAVNVAEIAIEKHFKEVVYEAVKQDGDKMVDFKILDNGDITYKNEIFTREEFVSFLYENWVDVNEHEYNFYYIPNEFYRDVVLEAVKEEGWALKDASDELKNDKEVVLEVVKQNCRALEFASDELKNDREVVLEAVKQDGRALKFASNELKNDKEVVLEAVKQRGRALDYASDELKNDKEIVLKAVKQEGIALGYSSDEFKNDKEVVLEAVKENGYALSDASKELRNDREVVLEAVKKNDWALQYISDELKNDKEVVLEAVKKNGYVLQYASDEFKNDKEIVLEAVKQSGGALKYASDEFKNDKEVVLEAVKERGWALEFASDELKNDKEVVLEAVKHDRLCIALQYASDELKNDVDFAEQCIEINPNFAKYIPSEIQEQIEEGMDGIGM